MPQLKIICLAHPATWSNAVQSSSSIEQKMLALKPSSRSWVNLNAERGNRQGIYKIEMLEKQNCIFARFISESEINEDHPCLEKLLADDNCLPENVKIPTQVPSALKALLFFDINEGVCYVYAPGIAPKIESVFETLESLEKDTGMPCKTAKVFEWEESIVTTVTEVARKEGFAPYKVWADLETVNITAEGDLDHNEKWKKMESAVELNTWRTVAYVKSSKSGMFVFGLTKRFKKGLSMPGIDPSLPVEELFNRILEMRHLMEKALGCDVRQYCFPQHVLSQFTR